MIYKKIIRPILFLTPAEFAHDLALFYLSIYNKVNFLNNILFHVLGTTTPRLRQKLFGLYFRTPIGLPAGMDKNIKAPRTWSSFGFAWCQLGSITYMPQKGNPKPRLWRLKQDKGLVINYGLSNLGAKKSAEILANVKKSRGLWSISIAKSNDTPMEQAAQDYEKSFNILGKYADIITINLSCPNVKNFGGLQKPELLEPILTKITKINTHKKPIWIKIGIDLNKDELDGIISLVKKYKIDAIVATNLSKDKSQLTLKSPNQSKPGSVSGLPIQQKADKIIAYLYQNCENKFKIIGTGGIFDAQDAYTKIKAGASLLQVATGFIYGGPTTIRNINLGLDKLLAKNNFKHISQAVGIEAKNYKYE
ncbi:quinone-dependent dihydroorotate dehydrogenase [Patescibacteria group bacterium]|nr:quinone-dependent dihydroorotate dehydrogenase [Patescibacteria group bacterium]